MTTSPIFYHCPSFSKSSSTLRGHLSFPQIQLAVSNSRSLHLFFLLPRMRFSEIFAWLPVSHYLGLSHTSSPSNTLAKEPSPPLIILCPLPLTCFIYSTLCQIEGKLHLYLVYHSIPMPITVPHTQQILNKY